MVQIKILQFINSYPRKDKGYCKIRVFIKELILISLLKIMIKKLTSFNIFFFLILTRWPVSRDTAKHSPVIKSVRK